MKYSLTIILSVMLFFGASAHAGNVPVNNSMEPTPYLFENFCHATVLYKTGKIKKALFNYHLVKEEMVFQQGRGLMVLDMSGIDTIYVGGKKFVPFGNTFCEVQAIPAGILYIRHRIEIVDQQGAIGYGGYSQTSSPTAQGGTRMLGDYYDLEARPKYEIRINTLIWIKRRALYEVNNSRQLRKAFPERKEELKQLARAYKTDFSKPNEVIQLLSLL